MDLLNSFFNLHQSMYFVKNITNWTAPFFQYVYMKNQKCRQIKNETKNASPLK